MNMKNIVLTGFSGVGKSTLIKKIIKESNRNIYGFITEKFPERCIDGLCPIYIYPAAGEPVFDDKHLIGLGGEGTHYTNAEVFDNLGVELISTNDSHGLIVMDEIGFLEAAAEKFKAKLIECLQGDIPTIVVMKTKMREKLMQEIASLPDIEYIVMDENNREDVYSQIHTWLKKI